MLPEYRPKDVDLTIAKFFLDTVDAWPGLQMVAPPLYCGKERLTGAPRADAMRFIVLLASVPSCRVVSEHGVRQPGETNAMTLTVDLQPELEARLRAEAARTGLTLAQLAAQRLQDLTQLARWRATPVRRLMDQLGIHPLPAP